MTRTFGHRVLYVVGVLAAATMTARAQVPRTGRAPLVMQSMAGRDNYEQYCATCHGVDGRGSGPVAQALTTPPADLTGLARLAGGAFPRNRIVAFVIGSGRPVAAHGSSNMPIWGPIFKGLDASEIRARQRIENVVDYIASLQAPSTAEHDPGRGLFEAHCAVCHASNGRGTGPMAGRLGQTPPDLTKFAVRNGGVFPSERVALIIDGRGIAAHGTPDMPVWGAVFRRRDGASDASVRALIDSIVRYLAGMQERAG